MYQFAGRQQPSHCGCWCFRVHRTTMRRHAGTGAKPETRSWQAHSLSLSLKPWEDPMAGAASTRCLDWIETRLMFSKRNWNNMERGWQWRQTWRLEGEEGWRAGTRQRRKAEGATENRAVFRSHTATWWGCSGPQRPPPCLGRGFSPRSRLRPPRLHTAHLCLPCAAGTPCRCPVCSLQST